MNQEVRTIIGDLSAVISVIGSGKCGKELQELLKQAQTTSGRERLLAIRLEAQQLITLHYPAVVKNLDVYAAFTGTTVQELRNQLGIVIE